MRATAFSPAKMLQSMGVRQQTPVLAGSAAGVREEMGGKQWLLFSKDDKDDKKSVPKGFEKFGGFKDKPATKDSKKEEESKKKEDEFQSDLSEEEEASSKEDSKKGDEKKGGSQNAFNSFFFDPQGSPKPEGFVAAVMALATAYYLATYQKPMKELVYMQFLNDYLLQNKIKEITIAKDRRSEVFNYRAIITTHDDERLYMTLNSIESFLAKLDLVQREMGKQPHDFIPVKYSNSNEENI